MSLSNFIQSFRAVYPQFAEKGPNGGFMQQDAEECFSVILQSLRNVPGVIQGDIISDLFEGRFNVT